MTVPTIFLNNGVEIPQLGFGTYQVPPEATEETVLTALEVGYRHIDTAQMYGNEKQVGQALANSGLRPQDVFVTSKLNNGYHAYADALTAFDLTLRELGLEVIDLFLIHWPLPEVGDFVQTWRALEQIYADGRARAIGVSNFEAHHLRRLHEQTQIVPAVNQIEVHPHLTQVPLRQFCAEHQIAVQGWSPIARGRILDNPTLLQIADAHQRTVAQVILRWHVQHGIIVFPKTLSPQRMAENFGIFDFELADDELALISALNRDQRYGPDPDTFNWIPS